MKKFINGVLSFFDKKKPIESNSCAAVTMPQSADNLNKNVVNIPPRTPDGKLNYDLFQDIENDSVLCYQYEDGICLLDGAIEFIAGKGGKTLSFVQETENPHDNNAIAIYFDDVKLGYVFRGNIQNMLNDWISRGHYFFGYINKYSVDEKKATFKIGFYKPLSDFESKQFSIVKTKKKVDEYTTREDYLLRCDEGETVSFEYDSEADSYIIYNSMCEEIGELPKSAVTYIKNSECKKAVGILESCETDINDKTTAKVSVFLI